MALGNIIDLFQKLIFGGPIIRAIMKEADDIQTKANLINTTDTSKLKGAADALKQAANTLKQTPDVANARAFKKEYDKFEKAYDALNEGDSDKAAEEPNNSEYFQATKLKEAAGSGAIEAGKLRKLAAELYKQADALATKVGGSDNSAAENLKNAVGQDENSGLRQALAALGDAPGGATNLTNLANAVRDKYQDVKVAYEAVQKQKQAYSTAGTQSKSELGHTNQTDLIQGNNQPQDNLKEKAGELAKKAGELNRVAGNLEEAAKQPNSPLKDLKDTAEKLKNAAKQDGSSTGLHQAANQLAKAKPGEAAESQADGVISAFDNVETQYETLMEAYKQILDKPEEASKLTQTDKGKVIEVAKKYFEVKNTYYQMLIGYRFRYLIGEGSDDQKILNKAKDLYTKASSLATSPKLQDQGTDLELKAQLKELATTLRDAVGENNKGLQQALKNLKDAAETNHAQIVTRALEVINKYKEVVTAYGKVTAKEKEYKELGATGEYTPVTEAFTQLEDKYNPLKDSYENVLRLRVYELSNLATTLSGAADTLKSAVPELQTQATALASAASNTSGGNGLKEKADALVSAIKTTAGGTNTQATAVITQFEAVKTAYDNLSKLEKYKELLKSALEKIEEGQPSLLTGDEEKVKNVEDGYNALKKLCDSILNLNETNTLLKAAGTSDSDQDKLRKLAKDLYTNANQLNQAVTDVSGDPDAARVLKAKAGTDIQKSDPKYLRGLAENLYEAANNLASNLGSVNDDQAAKKLAEAVGNSESDSNKLREKLKLLADHVGAEASELKQKAEAVTTQYETVKDKFAKVKDKKATYEGANKEKEYQGVEKAWDAFNDVYKPEELLATAVGANENTGLQNALKLLGTHSGPAGQLSGLAKAVKNKYSNFDGSGVKHKFKLVKAQAEAYSAGGTIKTEKYTDVTDPFNDFNKAYHEAI